MIQITTCHALKSKVWKFPWAGKAIKVCSLLLMFLGSLAYANPGDGTNDNDAKAFQITISGTVTESPSRRASSTAASN